MSRCIPHLFSVTLLSFLLAVAGANAQKKTLKLKEVTISGKRQLQETQYRVDSLITQSAYSTDLGRLLSIASPIFVKNYGRGQLSTVSFRGTGASHTQVWWNGMPLNSSSAGQTDFSALPSFLFDEVEISAGGNALQTSAGAAGAVVKLRTSRKWDEGWRLGYHQAVASYGTHQEALFAKWGSKRWQFSLKGYAFDSENDFQFEEKRPNQANRWVRQQNAQYSRLGLLSEVSFRPSARQLLQLAYWGQHMERQLPDVRLNLDPNRFSNQKDGAHRVRLGWQLWRKNAEWDLEAGYSATELHFDQFFRLNEANRLLSNSESSEKQLVSTFQGKGNWANLWHWTAQLRGSHSSVVSLERTNAKGYEQQRKALSGAFSISRNLFKKATLELLYRFVRTELPSTREALFHSGYTKLSLPVGRSEQLSVFGQISRNVKVPSLNELYFQPGGNPRLLPETNWQAEAGGNWSKPLPTGKVSLSVNLFWIGMQDRIFWQPDFRGVWSPKNWAATQNKGVELQTAYQRSWGKWQGRLRFGYTFTRATLTGTNGNEERAGIGQQLPYTPLHSANLLLHVQRSGWHLQYVWDSFSERSTTTDFSGGYLYEMPVYFMSDLAIGKKVKLAESISANLQFQVFNLLNESYRTVAGRPMPGRNIEIGLQVKWR